jgi:Leucine-rich repeat (LRR) protein
MESIEMLLKDGSSFTQEIQAFDVSRVTSDFNNQQILMVVVGSMIVNKNAVKMIAPLTSTETANYKVQFQDGKEITTYLDDIQSLFADLNNLKVAMTVVGDTMIDKRDIKLISPIQQ